MKSSSEDCETDPSARNRHDLVGTDYSGIEICNDDGSNENNLSHNEENHNPENQTTMRQCKLMQHAA